MEAEIVEDSGWSVKKTKKRKSETMQTESSAKRKRPQFPPAKSETLAGPSERRTVRIPNHRYTPLKENWTNIITPIIQHLHLDVRFNTKTRLVEIRTSPETKDIGALQKAADFVHAFALGFDIADAMALIRLDAIFLESFDARDVKMLQGDHLARAIGRIVGKNGKTKYMIENATKSRIVVTDHKIHLLGSYQSIRAARTSLCNLILGGPPSKTCGNLKNLANRLSESI